MGQCLALRKEVYGLLGYLPSDVMADPSGVELDSYDGRSIHFSAIRGSEVIGTVRVVLELPPKLEAAQEASGISDRGSHDPERSCAVVSRDRPPGRAGPPQAI